MYDSENLLPQEAGNHRKRTDHICCFLCTSSDSWLSGSPASAISGRPHTVLLHEWHLPRTNSTRWALGYEHLPTEIPAVHFLYTPFLAARPGSERLWPAAWDAGSGSYWWRLAITDANQSPGWRGVSVREAGICLAGPR